MAESFSKRFPNKKHNLKDDHALKKKSTPIAANYLPDEYAPYKKFADSLNERFWSFCNFEVQSAGVRTKIIGYFNEYTRQNINGKSFSKTFLYIELVIKPNRSFERSRAKISLTSSDDGFFGSSRASCNWLVNCRSDIYEQVYAVILYAKKLVPNYFIAPRTRFVMTKIISTWIQENIYFLFLVFIFLFFISFLFF